MRRSRSFPPKQAKAVEAVGQDDELKLLRFEWVDLVVAAFEPAQYDRGRGRVGADRQLESFVVIDPEAVNAVGQLKVSPQFHRHKIRVLAGDPRERHVVGEHSRIRTALSKVHERGEHEGSVALGARGFVCEWQARDRINQLPVELEFGPGGRVGGAVRSNEKLPGSIGAGFVDSAAPAAIATGAGRRGENSG